jgi:hypothetical protein
MNDEPRAPSQKRIAHLLAGVLGVATLIALIFSDGRPASAGDACHAKLPCAEGADCLEQVSARPLGGIGARLPGGIGVGTCVLRCGPDDATCPDGQGCWRGHCLTEAKANESCPVTARCEEPSECMSINGAEPMCRKDCASDDDCDEGQSCIAVDTALRSGLEADRRAPVRTLCLRSATTWEP